MGRGRGKSLNHLNQMTNNTSKARGEDGNTAGLRGDRVSSELGVKAHSDLLLYIEIFSISWSSFEPRRLNISPAVYNNNNKNKNKNKKCKGSPTRRSNLGTLAL